MEFVFAAFFLVFYYLRPQDWVPGLAGANLVKPIVAVWFLAFTSGQAKNTSLRGIFRTPHDWAILIYYLYAILTAPDPVSTMTGMLPLIVFFFLTTQSITSWDQLERYLRWWAIAVAVLAAAALGSLYGFDPMNAREATEHTNGRLSLGTWLHDNPNALGHTVITLIPMAYLLWFWRGTPIDRFAVFPVLIWIAYSCVLKTESKGTFLVGGALLVLMVVVGRPKWFQILTLSAAMLIGLSALNHLPRMSQMQNLRADEGVQGRLLAWEMARNVTRNRSTGEGWYQFQALIDWNDGYTTHHDIPKGTHSSYVKVAADLGRYGLFLYVLCIWCGLRTTLSFRGETPQQERCRRLIFILISAYLMSSWVINRQYHTEYFLMLAAAASMHRLRIAQQTPESLASKELDSDRHIETEKPPSSSKGHPPRKTPSFAMSSESIDGPIAPEPIRKACESQVRDGPGLGHTAPAFSTVTNDHNPVRSKRIWNKIGLLDVVASIGLTWSVFWFWDYILENI